MIDLIVLSVRQWICRFAGHQWTTYPFARFWQGRVKHEVFCARCGKRL